MRQQHRWCSRAKDRDSSADPSLSLSLSLSLSVCVCVCLRVCMAIALMSYLKTSWVPNCCLSLLPKGFN